MRTDGEPSPGASPIDLVKPSKQVFIGVEIAIPHEAKFDIQQAKKELIDPRIISKKNDPEGRSEMVRNVLEARVEARLKKKVIIENEKKIQKNTELTSVLDQQERYKKNELNQRLENVIVKVKKIFGIDDTKAIELQTKIDAIKSERDTLNSEFLLTKENLKNLREEIPNPKKILKTYYEKISTQPLSNEQKRELLKTEVLSSLSSEEYISLWKRLNPYFMSHVTRQGFRDHNAMIYHSAGINEFHDGFIKVMEDDGLLRPPMAIRELRNRDNNSIKEWLLDQKILGQKNEEQAIREFDNLLNFSLANAPRYPDKTAVHFATQLVANSFYGGENDNEVFFIYPSDVLASQYAFSFNGKEADFTRPQSDTSWNDVFVWPGTVDNPGISINAGIVFLPKSTPVDPETGSKYASEVEVVDGVEKRVMVKDTALVNAFVEWGKKMNDQSPFKQAFNTCKLAENFYRRKEVEKDCFAICVQELKGLGFLIDTSANLAGELIQDMFDRETYDDKSFQNVINNSASQWKRAEGTVSAKEYWESFFAKNPNLRPKHVQYYDGDPTIAVLEFQQRHHIGTTETLKTNEVLLGFDDHHVTSKKNDPRSNVGYEELVDVASRIIKEHYIKTTSPVAVEQ